jgi:hypothetical protein
MAKHVDFGMETGSEHSYGLEEWFYGNKFKGFYGAQFEVILGRSTLVRVCVLEIL